MQDNDPNSFKSTYEILEQIAEVIEELNDTEASELVQLMFGKSRANQGMAILQAFQMPESCGKRSVAVKYTQPLSA